MKVFLEENTLLQFVSSGEALFQSPLCMISMGQEQRRVMSGWGRLIWPTWPYNFSYSSVLLWDFYIFPSCPSKEITYVHLKDQQFMEVGTC